MQFNKQFLCELLNIYFFLIFAFEKIYLNMSISGKRYLRTSLLLLNLKPFFVKKYLISTKIYSQKTVPKFVPAFKKYLRVVHV